jgi:hypothetical protein
MFPYVILSPPLNHPSPSLSCLLLEKMEMAMPCPKKEVFLAKLARVNLLIPVPLLQHLKKNQLL